MPYIPEEQREALDGVLEDLRRILGYEMEFNDGAVNYVITRLLVKYVQYHGLRYKTLQSVAGLLASVGSEFERRVTVPYERGKAAENGDVYPPELVRLWKSESEKGEADGG